MNWEVNMSYVISPEDKKWRARDDANILATARVIYDNPERLKMAQDAAKEMAENQREEANAMSKVAGSKKMPAQKGSGSAITTSPLGQPDNVTKKRGGGVVKSSNKFNVFNRI